MVPSDISRCLKYVAKLNVLRVCFFLSWLPYMSVSFYPGCRMCLFLSILAAVYVCFFQSWLPNMYVSLYPGCRICMFLSILAAVYVCFFLSWLPYMPMQLCTRIYTLYRRKTVYLKFNVDRNLDGNSDSNIQGENLERVNTFKYIGAPLADNGDLDAEMTRIIQSGWKNWKRVSGILCDRIIRLKVKGKLHKTVVIPTMVYGAETWAVKTAQEKKSDVAEMRILRWMSGVTKLDRIILDMNELEGRRRWEKYPRKYRRVG